MDAPLKGLAGVSILDCGRRYDNRETEAICPKNCPIKCPNNAETLVQQGSLLRSGRRSRRFESSHPDQASKDFPQSFGESHRAPRSSSE